MTAPVALPGEVTITATSSGFIEEFIADADRRRECLLAQPPALNHMVGVLIRQSYVRRRRTPRPRRKPHGATAFRHAAKE